MPDALAKGIYWVGAIDWDLRYFHGYVTQKGSSYNAYLIIDEKIAIIDTVKAPFVQKMMERVSQYVDPAKVDYVISLHVEMDHSGGLPYVLEQCPNAKLVTSAPGGIKGLEAHLGPLDAELVKTGDILDLGKRTLQFVQTPMLHWPDNTMAYMKEEELLFSSDGFGQHYSSTARYDDQVPHDMLMFEAAKYYANIILPFGMQTKKALETASQLTIKKIAPAHGILWRTEEGIAEIIGKYAQWAEQKAEEKAVVVYDTMWHSTEAMAYAIVDGLESKGVPVQLMAIQQNHMSDVMVALLEAKYICVGSPTINNTMLPTIAGFLNYMKGLGVKNRIGMAFGSYGWSGQSPGLIQDVLKSLNWELPYEPMRLNFIPQKAGLDELKALAAGLVK